MLFDTSCKYQSSGRSCLGPAVLYSLGPCMPLSAVFIALDLLLSAVFITLRTRILSALAGLCKEFY